MTKYLLIARSNLRKTKGQTASMIVLILLAAFMLNLWLMLSMDYKANFDRYHTALNAEDVTLSVNADAPGLHDLLRQTLEADDRVAQYCLDPCMHMSGNLPYNGGTMTCWFVFLEKQAALTRSIGRIEIIEDSAYTSGVYLPLIYKTDDIAVGNPIEITIGNHRMTYTVCGFFNSIMMGSNNCTLTEMVFTQDQYAVLAQGGYAPEALLCSVRLKDRTENLSYEAALKNTVSGQYPNIIMMSNCYDNVTQARYISQMICSGIMSAMAFFVLLIALVMLVSNIVNYIQVNMKNLGVLKAAGYTSGQLILTLLLQFSCLTFGAAIAGAGASYSLFPAVNTMMTAQTGIPYAIRFLPLPLLLTLGILSGTVALAVWLAARRIRKIEPICALRSGIRTHNFRRNPIPLADTGLPLNPALALKTTLSGIRNNVTICITMLVLSLVVVFSGLMTENVIADMTPFLNLIGGEIADSCISVHREAEEDFLEEMLADERVEKVYLYTTLSVAHVDGAQLMATMCDDFSASNNPNSVFQGRFPRYDNEIAIAAKYAGEKDLRIGDEIEITANGVQEAYLICGFTQVSNNLGKDCLLTRTGYERLGTLTDTSYYLNLAPECDIDTFNREVNGKFAQNINTTINIRTTVESAAGIYVSLMTIIVIAVLVLSAIIIAFVLYLLVRTMLNNKYRDYGIMKALGFTTRQLIVQTALSFMPTAVLSTIIGLILCSLIINPLTALFLNGIGIVKCTFIVPAGFIAAAGCGLVLFAFAMACLLSLKIRKITPKALLTGE